MDYKLILHSTSLLQSRTTDEGTLLLSMLTWLVYRAIYEVSSNERITNKRFSHRLSFGSSQAYGTEVKVLHNNRVAAHKLPLSPNSAKSQQFPYTCVYG